MIAGTLALLERSVDEGLESAFADAGLPALEVKATQDDLADGSRPIQRGTAASVIDREQEVPEVASDFDGDERSLITVQEFVSERVMCDWVADVTDTGLVAASSVEGHEPVDFPWGMVYSQTGEQPVCQLVDVEMLHQEWSDDGQLGDVWLNAADAGEGAEINYHDHADEQSLANIGLGFTRQWGNTVMEGVVYESGYLAIYNCSRSVDFVQFVADELLPFCYGRDGSAPADGEGAHCQECGRESGSVGDDGLCLVCRDKAEEDAGQTTTLDDLETVNVREDDDK